MEWEKITDSHLKPGSYLVTNNPSAKNAYKTMSHLWVTNNIHKDKEGYWCFVPEGCGRKVWNLTDVIAIKPPAEE